MEDQLEEQQPMSQEVGEVVESKKEVKACSNFDKLRKKFSKPQTRSNCNRSETPQVPKGIFAKLRQKYLANSTRPAFLKVEATEKPMKSDVVDKTQPKNDGAVSATQSEEKLMLERDVQKEEQLQEQQEQEEQKEQQKEQSEQEAVGTNEDNDEADDDEDEDDADQDENEQQRKRFL